MKSKIALATLAMIPIAANNAYASNIGTVTASSLNVRSGPSTSYSVTASLRPGQVVVLISQSNGWYKVKLYNGTTGWVSSSYISKTDTYGESTASLNVRSGPGTNYGIKKAYTNGTRFDTYEIKNNWARTPSGWVCLDYCKLVRKY